MKTWIKRSLIGLTATALLLGGLAAWSHRHAHDGLHRSMSEADVVELRERFIDKAARKLDLDAAQQARLALLADALQAQRAALIKDGANPRAELQALVAGPRFDRDRAQALVEGKTGALREQMPAVVAAMADFYDGLRPEQQQQLRALMSRGRSHHG